MSSAAVNEKTASAIFASSVLRNAGARQSPYSKGPAARMATVTTGLANARASSLSSAGSLRAMLISQASRAPKETMVPQRSVKPSMSRPSVGDEVGEHRLFHAVAGSPRLYRLGAATVGSPRACAAVLFSPAARSNFPAPLFAPGPCRGAFLRWQWSFA